MCEKLFYHYSQTSQQEQYAFIHDAVLETLICGDSQIPASDIRRALDQLKKADKKFNGLTGFDKQFQVTTLTVIATCHQEEKTLFSV